MINNVSTLPRPGKPAWWLWKDAKKKFTLLFLYSPEDGCGLMVSADTNRVGFGVGVISLWYSMFELWSLKYQWSKVLWSVFFFFGDLLLGIAWIFRNLFRGRNFKSAFTQHTFDVVCVSCFQTKSLWTWYLSSPPSSSSTICPSSGGPPILLQVPSCSRGLWRRSFWFSCALSLWHLLSVISIRTIFVFSEWWMELDVFPDLYTEVLHPQVLHPQRFP